jgi:type IV secretion system protein TrbL
VKKTLYIGFFAWVINDFDALSKIVFDSFAALGLKVGGGSWRFGFHASRPTGGDRFDAAQPLLDSVHNLLGPVAFFTNFIQIFVLCLSWLIVLAAFFILAVQLFVALIEFKLTTLAGFVLIPFALFNRTAFLAEKVLGNVVSSGVKIMVLAVISAIASVLFKQFTTSYGMCSHHRAGDLGRAGLARDRRPVHLWRQHRQWADLRRPQLGPGRCRHRYGGRRDGCCCCCRRPAPCVRRCAALGATAAAARGGPRSRVLPRPPTRPGGGGSGGAGGMAAGSEAWAGPSGVLR